MRGALLAVVLSAGVILGLLGMHTLGGHESAHVSAATGGEADALGAVALHAHPGGDAPAAHAPAETNASGPSAGPATCAGCADLPSAGAACVLALLGGILLLALPVPWRMPSPPSGAIARVRADVVRPRGPSLHVLCISRT